MVDVQSNNQEDGARPVTSASQRVAQSPFKVYLEQNPEMAAQLIRVMLQLYQDPVKESEASA